MQHLLTGTWCQCKVLISYAKVTAAVSADVLYTQSMVIVAQTHSRAAGCKYDGGAMKEWNQPAWSIAKQCAPETTRNFSLNLSDPVAVLIRLSGQGSSKIRTLIPSRVTSSLQAVAYEQAMGEATARGLRVCQLFWVGFQVKLCFTSMSADVHVHADANAAF